MKRDKMQLRPTVLAVATSLMVVSLALTACNEQGSAGTKSAGKNVDLNCPELPVDSTATGEAKFAYAVVAKEPPALG